MFQSALLKPAVMWERHRNPLSGWTRVVLGLISPFIIWSHDWLMISLFIVAILTNPYWFPPVKKGNKNLDIMTRLVDAERWWLTKKATRLDMALLFLPAVAIALPAIHFLWVHSLFWGSFFFITGAVYKTVFSMRVIELAEEDGKTKPAAKKAPTKKTAAKSSKKEAA